MKKSRLFATCVAAVIIITTLLACNAPRATPTPDLSIIVAQTQTSIALDQFLTATSASNILPTAAEFPATDPPPADILATDIPVVEPSPTQTPQLDTPPPDCTDKAKFISESVPDESIYIPGEEFIKSWTLLNNGTCPWSPEYSLAFVNGEQMDGASPVPIGKTVEPGGQIQVSVSLTSPQEEGEYQGFWKLKNTRGEDFGLGTNADVAFWVKIIVSKTESSGDLDLGSPTWSETFENDSSVFPLGSGTDTNYEVEDGNLVITVFNSSGDLWRVGPAYLADFYIEARYKTGDSCSGKDGYGLLLRAPDQADNIIDSGYVFGFSCDGSFRAYLMANGSYSNIVSWTNSSNINAGPGQRNTLGVKAEGSSFQIYANGDLVYEFEDATYLGGLFGLMIRSDGTPNFQVLVQKVSYWLNP